MIFIRTSLLPLLLGLSVMAEAGQWCASVSGRVSGHSCYSSESECNDAVATAKREQGSGSAFNYSACTEEGGDSSAGTSSSGTSAENLITQGTGNLVDGMMNGSPDTFAAGALGIVGGALLQGMQSNPAEEARRRQAAIEQAAQQAEYARQLAIQEEERNRQLMSEMLIDAEAAAFAADAMESGKNELGLMMDDEPVTQASSGSAIMPNHKARPKFNPQPVAVIKQPQPVARSLADELLADAEPVRANPSQNEVVAAEPDPRLDDAAWQKGNRDGSQCFSASAGNHCAGAQGVIHQSCIANYQSGYSNGESLKRTLLANARQAGILDKQQSLKNSSFTNPNAQGPCRIQWIESYSEGYAGAPPASVGR